MLFGLVLVWARPLSLLLRCLLYGETQIWLGDLRFVLVGFFVCWLFVCVDVMICPRFWTTRVLFLNAFHRLRYCKDRA